MNRELKLALSYLRRYWLQYLLGILALFIVDRVNAGVPLLTGELIDGLTNRAETGFGLESINMDALMNSLKDKRVSSTIQSLMATAAKGGSIADTVKALAKNADVTAVIRQITGKDLSAILGSLNSTNLTSLLTQGDRKSVV